MTSPSAFFTVRDVPREQLQRIVAEYGRDILHDARRCRALLMDLCGEYRAEINLLEIALRENVVQEFERSSGRVPRSLEIARLARRLRDAYYLPEDAALWAVEACITALDGEASDATSRVLATEVRTTVQVRDWSAPDAVWVDWGTTPGRVVVPVTMEVMISAQLDDEAVGRLVADLMTFGPIQHLDLGYSELSDRGLRQIVKLEGLLGLDLSKTGISDGGLDILKAFPQLQTLSLWGCERVTDDGLKRIAGLRYLESLELGLCSRITGSGLSALLGLDHLMRLGLANTSIDDRALAHLGTLSALRHLDLAGTPVVGEGLREVAGLRELASLSLRGCVRLRPEGLAGLRSLEQLTTVDLGACGLLTDQALIYVRSLRGLVNLVLEGLPLTDAGMLYLLELPALARLDVSWTQVGDAGLARIATLKGLSELRLSGTRITDRGLASLAAMPDLAVLDLSSTRVTDAGLRALVAVPTLEVLDLEATQIHDAGLVHLGELPALRRVYLGRTGITDLGLELLGRISSVRSTDLTLCPNVSDKGIAALEEMGVTVSR